MVETSESTPTFRLYVGEVRSASALEGDPAVITYSVHGTAVWDQSQYIEQTGMKAYNPQSTSVEQTSAKPGDPCLIWVRSDNTMMLVLFTLKTPFDDCPAGAAP